MKVWGETNEGWAEQPNNGVIYKLEHWEVKFGREIEFFFVNVNSQKRCSKFGY